jgi:hypothetical protein
MSLRKEKQSYAVRLQSEQRPNLLCGHKDSPFSGGRLRIEKIGTCSRSFSVKKYVRIPPPSPVPLNLRVSGNRGVWIGSVNPESEGAGRPELSVL